MKTFSQLLKEDSSKSIKWAANDIKKLGYHGRMSLDDDGNISIVIEVDKEKVKKDPNIFKKIESKLDKIIDKMIERAGLDVEVGHTTVKDDWMIVQMSCSHFAGPSDDEFDIKF